MSSFKNFIHDIIKTKIKTINKKDFKSLFDYIDSFIEEKYDIGNKDEKTFLKKIFGWFLEENIEKDNVKNIILNDTNSYLNNFKQILIEYKFIDNGYTFDKYTNIKIIKYAKNYEYLKTNLKNDNHFQRSFYKEFQCKFEEILNYSCKLIINKFNNYLNEFILEVQAVIQTINSNFNMSQTEFEKKYSNIVKERILRNITNRFEQIKKSLKDEINHMKNNVRYEIQNLECNDFDPDRFNNNFMVRKQYINNIIEDTSIKIQIIYYKFQFLIINLIVDFQTNKNSDEKEKIISLENIQIKRFFRNDIQFKTIGYFKHSVINFFGWFFGFSHHYEDDIKNACNEYINMIYSGYEDIERNLVENFEELNNKGIEIINLIFKTAHSDFEELKRNIINYDRIIKTIHNIFKNNNLKKYNYLKQ